MLQKANIATQLEHDSVISYAQETLAICFFSSRERSVCTDGDLLQRRPVERLNITLRTHGRLRGSMSALGSSLGAQIQNAIKKTAEDKRFGARLTAGELGDVDMEVWLQLGSEQVAYEEICGANFLNLAEDGVEIGLAGKSAYYKPSVAITKRLHNVASLMGALCKKAKLPKDAWRDPGATVMRTKWIMLSSKKITVQPGKDTAAPSKYTVLQYWLRQNSSYLIQSRLTSGDFTYLYDPLLDVEKIKSTNRVRSSGCLYALSCFLDSHYASESSPNCYEAISSIASAHISRTILTESGLRVVPDPRAADPPRLGATALLALALGGKHLSREFGSAYDSLYESVVSAQLPSGRFRTHYGIETEDPRNSVFYSGQAILSILQRAEHGDQDALARCASAFVPYRQEFRQRPSTAFVGWHAEAWSKMASLTGRQMYAEFAFEQVDWLLQFQIRDAKDKRWLGGFSRNGAPPQFSTIVYLEAVTRAYGLASSLRDEKRVERYRSALHQGLAFVRHLQFKASQMAWFPNPKRSEGGVALSILDLRVRCDVPQHAITMCLAVLAQPDLDLPCSIDSYQPIEVLGSQPLQTDQETVGCAV